MLDPKEVEQIYGALAPFADEYNFKLKEFPLEWFDSTEALNNYTFVFPFERYFDRPKFFIRSYRIWIWSLLASMVYVAAVFGGQKLMTHRSKPFHLRYPLIVWNLLMASFSILGFCRVSRELSRVLLQHGFVYSVCWTTYGADPVSAFWTAAFVSSKFVELIDTAFLVLRKKPLQFLHWYHHVTVLVFSWHTAKGVTAAGRWYASMNYGVHSFMYAYYAITAVGYRLPRSVSMFVTSLQLSQMLMGVVISYAVFRAKFDWNITCHQSWSNLGFAVAIYASYLFLFAKYFYEAYVLKKTTSVGDRKGKSH